MYSEIFWTGRTVGANLVNHFFGFATRYCTILFRSRKNLPFSCQSGTGHGMACGPMALYFRPAGALGLARSIVTPIIVLEMRVLPLVVDGVLPLSNRPLYFWEVFGLCQTFPIICAQKSNHRL